MLPRWYDGLDAGGLDALSDRERPVHTYDFFQGLPPVGRTTTAT
ncbi:hypothetical protein [Streptomyces venezuelae]